MRSWNPEANNRPCPSLCFFVSLFSFLLLQSSLTHAHTYKHTPFLDHGALVSPEPEFDEKGDEHHGNQGCKGRSYSHGIHVCPGVAVAVCGIAAGTRSVDRKGRGQQRKQQGGQNKAWALCKKRAFTAPRAPAAQPARVWLCGAVSVA